MCGIAGIYCPNGAPPGTKDRVRTMIEKLHHRGPDGYGFYNDELISLGHARLSIIDLATGDQPIRNEDGTVWVVFNGEIFNYIELRAQLESYGHRFYTESDTEVIVHLYEQYGNCFFDKLNGQFAIALWDTRKKCLLLARDRVGIRPVFYSTHNGEISFASEIKSLLAVSTQPRTLNLEAVAEVFTFWSSMPPNTAFEGVFALPPGSVLLADQEGIRVEQFWDWTFPDSVASQSLQVEDLAAELRDVLLDAVRLRLRSDVPVGAYLSGGLDSSVIATLIRRYTDTPLRTFSVEFEDSEFDERPFQQDMVKHLGAEHTRVMCRKSDISTIFPRLIYHTETPVVRTAPAPLMILADHVHKQGYKVVLTGEGADEVFGGYDLFKEAKIRRFWARYPKSEWRPQLLSRLYGYLSHSPTSGGAFSKIFFGQGLDQGGNPGFAHMARWSVTQRLWNFFSADVRADLAVTDPISKFYESLPDRFANWLPIGRDQYVEAKTLLAGYLLSSQGDRVAMAHSVEGRFPFLDYRGLAFASRLHPELKIRGLNEKFLLKKAMGDLLPGTILQRVKQPYRSPDSASFMVTEQPEYIRYLMSEENIRQRGYFDPDKVSRLMQKCSQGRSIGFADNMAFVGILSTMLLDEIMIRGNAVS